MNSFEKKNKPKGPIFEELDISKAETWNGMQGYKDFIISRLKELGLYFPDLVYRGFDGNKINIVKKNGTDTPESETIFGSTENELADLNHSSQDALVYALEQSEVGGMSVYDRKKLDTVECRGILYRPKSGMTFKDALVASFKLKEK